MDINNVMLNPIRMRIVQVTAANGNVSASFICENMPDVPRTTVYRHIRILIDNGILTVVAENKVRGSLERVLSFNIEEITRHNTLENATQNAFAFLMNRYARFDKYFKAENPNPAKDRIFLNNTILMTTDEEFDAFIKDLQELLQRYSFEYSDQRRARDISIISAPDEREGGSANENGGTMEKE